MAVGNHGYYHPQGGSQDEPARRCFEKREAQSLTPESFSITFPSPEDFARRHGSPSSMPSTVNARIPLSLLEAIRRIDTPPEPTDTEYVPELRNKRLGLSDTVFTQIRRYSDAMKRGQPIPSAEAEGLGTLIGRRPDADELFRSAGRILARDIYESVSPARRSAMHNLPGFMGRRLALKQLRVIAGRYFGGTLEKTGSSLSFKVPDSATVNGSSGSAGCIFYETALRELLDLVADGLDNVEHVQCVHRGDGICEWRAEWGPHKE